MEKVRKVLFIVFLFLSNRAMCADPPAPTGGAGVPPPPGLPLPIDDYLPALMIAGVLLGIYYFQKNRKFS